MTTLVTGDLHASAHSRDEYRWHFIERTLPALVAEHDVSRVIIVGDLTESKDGHPAGLVNRLVDAFAALAEHAHVYCLRGNHDYLAEQVPFFRFLSHIERVRWINEPTALKLRGLGRCLFLPHTRNLDDWVDWMFDEDGFDWFFCHQTFADANLGSAKATGPAAPFTGDALAISGDVHTPQKLGKVIYVGAPYLIDFGDQFEPRILLLKDKTMKSIPVDGPQKRLMVLSGKDPLAGLKLEHCHPLLGIFKVNAGDVVKVKVELPPGSELSRAEVRARVREWANEMGVRHMVQVKAPPATAAIAAVAARRDKADDAELVRAYAKKMGKGKATISAGLKITEETA